MDITVIVAMVTAFSAIIAPVLTAIINNRHNFRVKKMELYQTRKINAIEKYLQTTGLFLSSDKSSDNYSYNKCLGEIYLYAPKSVWHLIDELDAQIKSRNFVQAQTTFNEVCKQLSNQFKI